MPGLDLRYVSGGDDGGVKNAVVSRATIREGGGVSWALCSAKIRFESSWESFSL